MKAVFWVRVEQGRPVLPAYQVDEEAKAKGEPELYYNYDAKGVPQNGGYSMVGPIEKNRVIVIVDAPDATIEAMRKDPKNCEEVTLARETEICMAQKINTVDYKKLLSTPWASDLVVKAAIEK